MSARYIVIGGSQSGHCCFNYSVCDTKTLDERARFPLHEEPPVRVFATVCECVEEHHAKQIASALNEAFFAPITTDFDCWFNEGEWGVKASQYWRLEIIVRQGCKVTIVDFQLHHSPLEKDFDELYFVGLNRFHEVFST